MKRVVVDHYGGPEVLRVVEEDDPRPGPGEVRVRVLAAGVSFTDAQLRAGTYLGVPKPPFTPGYELVGVVEELGPGCSRLRVGDRVGALTVWGADAERVCVPEANAVEVPEDLDPAEVVSLVLHLHDRLPVAASHGEGEERGDGARARRGRQGGHRGPRARSAWPGFACTGPASARDRAAVERLGAVAIDYRNEDFLARVRELPGKGVDVVLDGLGGALSLRSFRALRPGGRLVVFGHYATLAHGRKSWRGWIEWYAATATVALWGLLSPRRRVFRLPDPEAARAPPGASRWRQVPGRFPWVEVPATRSGSGRTSARCSSCSARARSTRSSPSGCRSPRRAARMSCWSSPRRGKARARAISRPGRSPKGRDVRAGREGGSEGRCKILAGLRSERTRTPTWYLRTTRSPGSGGRAINVRSARATSGRSRLLQVS